MKATAIARTNVFLNPVAGRSDAHHSLEPGESVEIVSEQDVQSTDPGVNKSTVTFVKVKKSNNATGWVIKAHLEIAGAAAGQPS